jgi:hypothetical protein
LARNVMVDTQLWEILQQSWVLERLAEATESKKHLTHDGAKVSVNRHFQKVIAEQYYRKGVCSSSVQNTPLRSF